MENQPGPLNATNDENPINKHKSPIKILVLILIAFLYTIAVSTGSITAYKKIQDDNQRKKLAQIIPNNVVHQGLVKFTDTKTVTRTITYRDSVDSSMLVRWDIMSDFSNTRAPKSKGTVTIDYLLGQSRNVQKLEFVAIKGEKYQNNLYFRITEGNKYTNAPTGWYTIQEYDRGTYGPHTIQDLYQRDNIANVYKLSTKDPGFKKFDNFDFTLFNNPAFYLIVGDMRDGPEKAKIISEVNDDKAYVLSSCDKNLQKSWCSGSFNTGGLYSIASNYATSEGLGTEPGLTFDSTHFALTADNSTKAITQLEVGQDDSHKFIVTYTNINQPVTIAPPPATAGT